ncbi:vitelline membrane outer layer protein 1 homolog [Protopterus annectens]|uniref:vitelline membrane outer layer protein 1 homolog n=1 Tax=Protopterus annectens TaxID=7888 RepID=UPI001CFAD965|nr:vitelline membrane outer layer protein 1 homolog [Protopterus annectens]
MSTDLFKCLNVGNLGTELLNHCGKRNMMLKTLFLLSILFFFSDAGSIREERSVTPVITVTNGGPWGSWGWVSQCPWNSKAIGFSLKIEGRQGRGDDTAMNGIRLYCSGGNGYVESKNGPWGDWTSAVWCPGSGVLTAFALQVESRQGDGDDTAANNIKFMCSSGPVIEGIGQEWGSYGAWSGSCDYGISGLQTKVEDPQGRGDDTALNDVQFSCLSKSN